MSDTYINDKGVVKEVLDLWTKDSGQWYQVQNAWLKDKGEWQLVFAQDTVCRVSSGCWWWRRLV